jgi:hypothetical protein
MAGTVKVGIIACSGEEIPGGTLSRLATRRVLELLRPQTTVTLCLPLFLAGEEQERRFAQQHPTITVDGCDKLCAKRGTQQYSGQVAVSLDVSEIVGDRLAKCHRAARDFDQADEEAVWILAERIAAEVDGLAALPTAQPLDTPPSAACGCACGTAREEGRLQLENNTVIVSALPLIFDHLYKQGLTANDARDQRVLDMVRIYHAIAPEEEPLYREALAVAFIKFCQSHTTPA